MTFFVWFWFLFGGPGGNSSNCRLVQQETQGVAWFSVACDVERAPVPARAR